MIQFNLLPDVKLAYLKAERTKRLVISVSVLASAVAIFVLVALFVSVNVVQKKNLNDLNRDIRTNTVQIQNTPNVNKILTIQSQLAALTGLHDQKVQASRLFTYIGQVTPATVTISNITTDFTQQTLAISGSGPSLDVINTFADTLKFTTYTTDKVSADTNAFTNVVLTNFSRTKTGATYTINVSYDQPIFDITNKVNLKVPNTTTTRSVTEQPSIFKQEETKR